MSQGHQVPSINRVAPVARFRYLAALRLLPLFQLLSFQSFSFRLCMSLAPIAPFSFQDNFLLHPSYFFLPLTPPDYGN